MNFDLIALKFAFQAKSKGLYEKAHKLVFDRVPDAKRELEGMGEEEWSGLGFWAQDGYSKNLLSADDFAEFLLLIASRDVANKQFEKINKFLDSMLEITID